MTKDFEELLLSGYSYCRQNAGPLIIGKDFEAPAPAAAILPRIQIERHTLDKLLSFVADRSDISPDDEEIFAHATKLAEFENGVSEALNWYISDHHFQAELPTFRKHLKDLRKAIERFQSDIPDDNPSIVHFLHATYTGEVFLRDQRKPSSRELTALQNSWQKHAGFLAVQRALHTMLRNIEAAQLLIGNRKPRDHRVKGFVQALAVVWKRATGTWPSNTRDPVSNMQAGRFADFVRATNEILPRTFRIPSLDAAIRAACEATDES